MEDFSAHCGSLWRGSPTRIHVRRAVSRHGFCATDLPESLRDIESAWRLKPSFTTWASARRSLAPRWPMPTNAATGASIRVRPAADHQARKLYVKEDFGVELTNTSMPWTPPLSICAFRCFPGRSSGNQSRNQVAYAARSAGCIPSFIHISDGKLHDVNVLDLLILEPGAIYVMDRGYLDFERLYALDQAGGFFVTRAKQYLDARRLYSAPVDRDTGVLCDQTIALNGFYAARVSRASAPDQIRTETGKNLVFLTNQLPAGGDHCALYRCRWQVELSSSGSRSTCTSSLLWTSENAVKTQIWIAVAIYVLVAIVKKRINRPEPPYTFTDFVADPFRENAVVSSVRSESLQKQTKISQSTEIVRSLTGHY